MTVGSDDTPRKRRYGVIALAIVAVRVVWSSRGEWRAAVAAGATPGADDEIVHLDGSPPMFFFARA